MNHGLQRRVSFLKGLKHYKFQHHLDCPGKCGSSWLNSITKRDTRQSFGVPHQLYLLFDRHELEYSKYCIYSLKLTLEKIRILCYLSSVFTDFLYIFLSYGLSYIKLYSHLLFYFILFYMRSFYIYQFLKGLSTCMTYFI